MKNTDNWLIYGLTIHLVGIIVRPPCLESVSSFLCHCIFLYSLVLGCVVNCISKNSSNITMEQCVVNMSQALDVQMNSTGDSLVSIHDGTCRFNSVLLIILVHFVSYFVVYCFYQV